MRPVFWSTNGSHIQSWVAANRRFPIAWTYRRTSATYARGVTVLRGLRAVADHADDPGRLKGFRRPVLIVTGKDTVAFHRRINDILAASLAAAERVELPGGHKAPAEARDQFVAELRVFFARHR